MTGQEQIVNLRWINKTEEVDKKKVKIECIFKLCMKYENAKNLINFHLNESMPDEESSTENSITFL